MTWLTTPAVMVFELKTSTPGSVCICACCIHSDFMFTYKNTYLALTSHGKYKETVSTISSWLLSYFLCTKWVWTFDHFTRSSILVVLGFLYFLLYWNFCLQVDYTICGFYFRICYKSGALGQIVLRTNDLVHSKSVSLFFRMEMGH